MVTKDFLDSKEYAVKREAMTREINRACYNTKERSSERWRKTKEERAQLKQLKGVNKFQVTQAGHNPAKRFNVSEPVIGRIW